MTPWKKDDNHVMTPWEKDDDHDEGVEGLLADHPVDHFPHTRNIKLDVVSRERNLFMF